MPGNYAQTEGSLKVFISYSRRDEDFAQELLAGLKLAGFEPYLDKHDIAAGEDWEARLGRLIEAADTVVFVISPDAVASERCAWEVERTFGLKKRLLPVVWRRVEEAAVPPRLKQLNYIFFDRPLSFAAALTALADALRTDVDWIREHTRIGEAALRWDARGRADALLFRAEELAAARAWLVSQPTYATEPTLLHHAFIQAAADAETARSSADQKRLDDMRAALDREQAAQAERASALERERLALRRGRRALAASVALLGCVGLGAVGWWQQAWIAEQYHWRVVMRPSVLTATEEKAIAAKPGADFRECANGCPTMIVVPAGSFLMGSPETEKDRFANEGPQRSLTIARPFAVSQTEATFDQWDVCIVAGACPKASDNGWGRGDRPVINVNWDDAKLYVAWLSRMTGRTYRLLSEAEWEYAARAGSDKAYAFGDNPAELGEHAWFNENTAGKTEPVGTKKANAYGLLDMHGNVYEWAEDCWHPNYSGAPANGETWITACADGNARVIRGGSWINVPRNLRASDRLRGQPGIRNGNLGFRVARTLNP